MRAGSTGIAVLVTVVLAVLFVWGVTRLFQLRFEAGNIYPPYSSLRRDPLGTKAFHDSLQELAGDRVQRNYEAAPAADGERGRTWLVLGLAAERLDILSAAECRQLETLLTGQGRLVLGLSPAVESGPTGHGGGWRQAAPSADEEREERLASGERWGLHTRVGPKVGQAQRPPAATTEAELPASIPWHSQVIFEKLGSARRVVYACEGQPVMIERKLAGGTLVVVADSYLFSNEALQKERQPAVLAWLVGQPARVIFDESHFGIEEHPGVMTLVRRYQLHGVVAALVVVAGLFVWKVTVPFVPPVTEPAARYGAGPQPAPQCATGTTAGCAPGTTAGLAPQCAPSTTAGLVTLLRRSVPVAALLPACLADWKKACGHGRADLPAKEARLAAFADQADVVAAYREMQRIVEEK